MSRPHRFEISLTEAARLGISPLPNHSRTLITSGQPVETCAGRAEFVSLSPAGVAWLAYPSMPPASRQRLYDRARSFGTERISVSL